MSDSTQNDYESVSSRKSPARKKKKTKFTLSDGIRLGVIVIAAGVFVYALVQLIRIQDGYKEAQDIYADIDARVVSTKEYSSEEDDDRLVEPNLDIDWDKLYAEQEKIVGWIQVPSCDISYPIVRGEDNDYYLNHTYNDQFSYSGAIFLDYRESSELIDDHLVIYGHHMKDTSMFCDLLEYDDEAFYEKNEGYNYFFIYTKENIRVYKIFSICDVNINDNPTAYTIDIDADFTISDYAAYVQSVELYDTGVEFNGRQIATLFTCQTDSQSNVRHMVHGMFVETIEYGAE